jgi:beta-glucanase (GH16 family)
MLTKGAVLTLLLLALCGPTAADEPAAPAPDLYLPASADDVPPGWQLVWHDEFNGRDLDRRKWGFATGGTGFGNNELQYYTDEPENTYVVGGHLVIVARRERYMGLHYTSAKLQTLVLAEWQYGRIDIRARMPAGQGLWPAFWMLPSRSRYGGWPAGGEIDIMELLGHAPQTVHGTLHYGASGQHEYTGSSYTLPQGTFADGFHLFSLIREPNSIRWYVDGRLYQEQTIWFTRNAPYPAPFDQPFYLILNLAVGGNWPGSPDATTVFPARLRVDYVRVYQPIPAD